MRDGAEDADNNTRDDKGAEDGLQEDGILDPAKGRLLDPHLAVEDFADEIALLVLGHPRLVLEAIAELVRIELVPRISLQVDAGRLVIRNEEFPRIQVTAVQSVQEDTHSLPGSDQCGDTDHETDHRQYTPSASSTAESDENSSNKTSDDEAYTENSSEGDARAIAVADSPPNEAGMCMAAKRPLDRGDDVLKRRRVGGVLEGVE